MSSYQPPRLTPMSVADIVDASIRLYRRNFGPFVGITAIVYAPMGVLQIIMMYAAGQMMQNATSSSAGPAPEHLAVIFGTYIGLLLMALLAVPISQGALSIAVSRRYLNYPVTVGDAYSAIGVRWASLIGAVFLTVLMIGGVTAIIFTPGTMLVAMLAERKEIAGAVAVGVLFFGGLVVAVIYLWVKLMFVTAVVAVEGTSAVAGITRSWNLVSNEWWRCFGTYFLLGLVTLIIMYAVSYPVSAVAMFAVGTANLALGQAISGAVTMVANMVIQPILIVALVLLYYDLRVRKEGFDLQLLARAMKLPETELPTYESYVKPEPSPVGQAAPTMPTELWEYVWQAVIAGMTYEQAREQLLGGGWPQATVDQHLATAWSAAQSMAPAPQPVASPTEEPPAALATEPATELPGELSEPSPAAVDPFSPEQPPQIPPSETP